MSILGSLKRLIFGVNIDSVEQARMNESTHPVKINEADVNTEFFSVSRNLLKEATALKREKKFFEACEKLREAYSADGAENLMIEDRLRLPMYLQLAGKNDEGWDELNRLNVRYVDQFSQLRIANQRTVFLQKEGNQKATNPVRSILHGENTPMPLSLTLERTRVKMGELQNAPMPSWTADVFRGFEFSATLQLRTPLRVLRRDGEIHTDIATKPPEIAKQMWEGFWVLQTITFRELGIDIDEVPTGSQASEIGPILPAEYLPFLIAVRTIVETHEPVETRIEKLIRMPLTTELVVFAQKHGGMNELAERFFPHFINGIPRIQGSAKYALSELGLNTPNKLAAASDEIVLSIQGIGPVKLQVIRDYCASIVEKRDSERLDNVYR